MQIDKIRGHQTDQLFKAMLELKDLDECYEFFDDLGTISELQSLAQRLEVAQMLMMKKTYDKIQGETGASTATISQGAALCRLRLWRIWKSAWTFISQANEEEVD